MCWRRYGGWHGRQTSIAAVNRRSFAHAFPWTRVHARHDHRHHRHDDVTRRHDASRDFRSDETMQVSSRHYLSRHAGGARQCIKCINASFLLSTLQAAQQQREYNTTASERTDSTSRELSQIPLRAARINSSESLHGVGGDLRNSTQRGVADTANHEGYLILRAAPIRRFNPRQMFSWSIATSDYQRTNAKTVADSTEWEPSKRTEILLRQLVANRWLVGVACSPPINSPIGQRRHCMRTRSAAARCWHLASRRELVSTNIKRLAYSGRAERSCNDMVQTSFCQLIQFYPIPLA